MLRAVFVASAAAILIAAGFVVGQIIRSDLQARATAITARRSSQADIVTAVLNNFQYSTPKPASNLVVLRASDGKWYRVLGFGHDNSGVSFTISDSANSTLHSSDVSEVYQLTEAQ